MNLLLLTLFACTAGTDTDTATTPVSLDGLVSSAGEDAWGCRWAYVAAVSSDHTLVADLILPEADRYANLDVSYARALEPDERIEIGGGSGGDELAVFDCSDVMETSQGIQVWRATAATIRVDAVYVGERTEQTCSGTDPNPVYDAELTITDATFTDMEENVATLTAWGPLAVEIGMDNCGG